MYPSSGVRSGAWWAAASGSCGEADGSWRRVMLCSQSLSTSCGGGYRPRGLAGSGAEALHHLVELSGLHHLHGEVHPRVVGTAELGAPTDEGAGAVDLADLELVDLAGDHVPLEQELGHPEGVDDVRRGLDEADAPVLGQDQHRGRAWTTGHLTDDPAVLHVAELPLPAEPDHGDGDIRVRGRLVDIDLV